jgi:hypothetical protein
LFWWDKRERCKGQFFFCENNISSFFLSVYVACARKKRIDSGKQHCSGALELIVFFLLPPRKKGKHGVYALVLVGDCGLAC